MQDVQTQSTTTTNIEEQPGSLIILSKEVSQSVKSVLCKQKEKLRCDAKTPPYTIFNKLN